MPNVHSTGNLPPASQALLTPLISNSNISDSNQEDSEVNDFNQEASKIGWDKFPFEIQKEIIKKVKEADKYESNLNLNLVNLGMALISGCLVNLKKVQAHRKIYDILINQNIDPILLYPLLKFFLEKKGLDIQEAALSLPEKIEEKDRSIIERRARLSIPILESTPDCYKLKEMMEIEESPLNTQEIGVMLYLYFGKTPFHFWGYLLNKANRLTGHTPKDDLPENIISPSPENIIYFDLSSSLIGQIICACPENYLGYFIIKLIKYKFAVLSLSKDLQTSFLKILNEKWPVISNSQKGKILARLVQEIQYSTPELICAEILNMIGRHLEVKGIHSSDMEGILMGLARTLGKLEAGLRDQAWDMMERILKQRAISKIQLGQIVNELARHIEYRALGPLESPVLKVIESKLDAICDSDMWNILTKLERACLLSPSGELSTQVLGVIELILTKRACAMSKTKMEEIVLSLIQNMHSLKSASLEIPVLALLARQQNFISGSAMENIVGELALQISSLKSETLQLQILRLIERMYTQQIISEYTMGSIVAELVRSLLPLRSESPQSRVPDVLEPMLEQYVQSKSEIGEIVEKLLENISFLRSESLQSLALKMLEDEKNADAMPKSKIRKMVMQLASSALFLESPDLKSRAMSVLEHNLNVLGDGDMGKIFKIDILKKSVRNISPSHSEELQSRVLSMIENNLNVIDDSEMGKILKSDILKKLVRNIWPSHFEELQSRILSMIERNLNVIDDSDMRDILKKLVRNISPSYSEKLQSRILSMIESNLNIIDDSSMGYILENLALYMRFFKSGLLKSQSRILLLIQNHTSRVSERFAYEIFFSLARHLNDLEKNSQPQVIELLRKYCADYQNASISSGHQYAYCKDTIDAHTSLFRKTLLRVSAAFQNAWKWFLGCIPSAFRVHIF